MDVIKYILAWAIIIVFVAFCIFVVVFIAVKAPPVGIAVALIAGAGFAMEWAIKRLKDGR